MDWQLKREEILGPAQWAQVLAVLPSFSLRDQVLVHLLAGAGLRREEASALDVEDLRLDQHELVPYVVVRHGKGDKYGEVLISERLAEMLRAFVGFRREGPVFISRKKNVGDGRIQGGTVNEVVTRVGERAGLPFLHAHQLRHFFGTSTLRQSGSLDFARRQLRHSSIKVTQVYLDLWLEDGARHVEALDRLLSNPVGEMQQKELKRKVEGE
jgi:integrase